MKLGNLPLSTLAVLFCVTPVFSAAAQSAAALVAKGDASYEARNASDALSAYQQALATDPNNYDALWRAARSGVDLAAVEPSADQRTAMYKTAQDQAGHAVQLNPSGADGHFILSEALGRMAQSLGPRDRVKYAGRVRDEAMACLKIEPKHAGCLHVMGVWNAEVMRLNGLTRMIARNFLGGQIFSEASWANARHYLEEAVTNDPRRIVHRLDLARVYADIGLKPQAKTEYQIVIDGELIDYNDPIYKKDAAEELERL
jgi:tetratricopeptide (TPR) repeat protein